MDEKNLIKIIDQRLSEQTKQIDQRLVNQTKEIDLKLSEQTKEIDQKLADQTKELQCGQKLLLEEFQHQLGVVAEGHGDLVKKLDNHTRILNATMEMVASNTENIEMIKSMLKQKVDVEEFEHYTKRLISLEKKVRALQN